MTRLFLCGCLCVAAGCESGTNSPLPNEAIPDVHGCGTFGAPKLFQRAEAYFDLIFVSTIEQYTGVRPLEAGEYALVIESHVSGICGEVRLERPNGLIPVGWPEQPREVAHSLVIARSSGEHGTLHVRWLDAGGALVVVDVPLVDPLFPIADAKGRTQCTNESGTGSQAVHGAPE